MSDPEVLRLAQRVLWPGFAGRTAPDWLRRALETGLGGAVLFANNLDPDAADAPASLGALTDELHDAGPRALIGVDEEGGTVTRLDSARGSSEPGNAPLGRVDDVAATERSAARIGARLAAAGVDIDLAPDADVNVDPRNPVIGVRSFGADPALVARHTAAAVRGLQSAGVAACAKHFPGHGDTATDSHLALPVSQVSLEVLFGVHLPPFRAAIDAGVKAVMTAHIRVPALGDAPATLNPDAIGLLRNLGFEGVVISDAVDMAAIRASVGLGRGAVLALLAGVDLVCIGNPDGRGPSADELEYSEVRDAVLAAVASGELPVARLEEAGERLEALGAWRAGVVAELQRAEPAHQRGEERAEPAYQRGEERAEPVHQRVEERAEPASRNPTPTTHELPDPAAAALDIAARALERTGDIRLAASGPVLCIDARGDARTMAEGPTGDRFGPALAARFEVVRPSGDPARAAAEHSGEVVLLVGTAQSNPPEAAIRDAVLAARPDAVLVTAGWPDPALPEPARAIRAWGSARPNAEAVAGALAGD